MRATVDQRIGGTRYGVGWISPYSQPVVVAKALEECCFEDLAMPLIRRANYAGCARVLTACYRIISEGFDCKAPHSLVDERLYSVEAYRHNDIPHAPAE